GPERIIHCFQDPVEQLAVALPLGQKIRRLLHAGSVDEYFVRHFTLARQAAAEMRRRILTASEQEGALLASLYLGDATSRDQEHLLHAIVEFSAPDSQVPQGAGDEVTFGLHKFTQAYLFVSLHRAPSSMGVRRHVGKRNR